MAARGARNQGHNHIRDWWAGVPTNCGDRVETEQFVSEYEQLLRRRADITDVVGYPTYHDAAVRSPFTSGMPESKEFRTTRTAARGQGDPCE